MRTVCICRFSGRSVGCSATRPHSGNNLHTSVEKENKKLVSNNLAWPKAMAKVSLLD